MENEQLNNLRHSAAHLLAAAVLRIWPDTKLTIGPAIENGFYYDFDFKNPISETDLPKIEKMMAKTLTDWDKFAHREVTEQEAREFYKDNPYKLELIDEIVGKDEKITFYKAGYFEDLCRGGHSEKPNKDIGAFKLLSLAGAYWRGSEKNPMLTRIYGTAFPTQTELDEHLSMLEEAKRRDHKKLGPQLDLFMFHETAPGMPYWLPKGVTIYNELIQFWRDEHAKAGYQEIKSPLVNKKDLYITSGHFDHYWDDMFNFETLDGEEYALKAMNCPNAMIVFGSRTRSYKDLPLRLGDTDMLHRYERSGTLNGLLRVREFSQDDAHIFVAEDQIQAEFKNLFALVERFYSIFGLEYTFRLGTRPEKFMGDPIIWDKAEATLENLLKESNIEYFIVEGEGAFYGPKIDILMKDSLGRQWQMGTLQLDFQQPLNFILKYAASDGSERVPIVIHRVIYGSIERFMGLLVEHFGGAFPLWIAPVQITILPISDKVSSYAQTLYQKFNDARIRVELDESNQTIGAKIREATLQKVPYLCIIGEKEESESSRVGKEIISIRTRDGRDLGNLELSEFLESIKKEIEKKT